MSLESIWKSTPHSTSSFGPLAHLVERYICNVEVAGSSPARSTSSLIWSYEVQAREILLVKIKVFTNKLLELEQNYKGCPILLYLNKVDLK